MAAHKILISATLLMVLSLLIGGIYYSQTFVMSFAETSLTMTVLRAVLALLLAILLITEPPRSLLLRAVIGVASFGLVALSAQLVSNYQLQFFDAIIFIETAIIFAIEALETRRRSIPVSKRHTPTAKIPVVSI